MHGILEGLTRGMKSICAVTKHFVSLELLGCVCVWRGGGGGVSAIRGF